MPSLSNTSLQAGTRIRARGEEWTIASRPGNSAIQCLGLSGIVRGKRASFLPELEPDIEIIDPADVELITDQSPGFMDTKLHIEAAARQYVRKITGVQKTSVATEAAFERAVVIITEASAQVLHELPPRKVPPKTEPPLRRLTHR